MLSLAPDLRSILEKAVIRARDTAEDAARAFLEPLDITNDAPKMKLTPDANRLRIALRAKAKQLGGDSRARGLPLLVEQIAYEQWHRMLFARFLAENNLLMHPELGVPVTLQECVELAPEYGEPDGWQLAARFASEMLPGIFRQDTLMSLRGDLSLRGDALYRTKQSPFARESQLALEKILENIPSAIFRSDDGLGWVYQFWQTKKKKEVNASERKIGGADIAPVTQLFTEDYMVRFLLENTLGAWWAARHPNSPLLKEWNYLRFLDDGTPAAGTFDGWQKRAAEITFMDPCCGSGHFCVYAFELLLKMRMEEEGLNERDAGDAVLRDNLYALELDPRCTQIAAFALALAAWKSGGYRKIPVPHIACSGIAVQGQLEEWTKLARGDAFLKTALERLYELFKHAPDLGSLINPADVPENEKMFTADYARVEPLLEKALARERKDDDPVADVFGAAAEETMSAAKLLAGKYTLVATNVPYLTRSKQDENLKDFGDSVYPNSKADLSTMFVERCRSFAKDSGTYAIVTPQNWLSLGSYAGLRIELLRNQTWQHASWLGPGAFDTISGEVVKPVLLILNARKSTFNHRFSGVDVSNARTTSEKSRLLMKSSLQHAIQSEQLDNPDARISLEDLSGEKLLEEYAISLQGISPADLAHYGRFFWEINMTKEWHYWQGSPESTLPFAGRSKVLWWNNDLKEAIESGIAYIRGEDGWGKRGVAVGQMQQLPSTLYTGEKSDTNVAIVIPKKNDYLSAIWAFCQSPEYNVSVRRLDQKMNVTNATLVKVPFDLEHWQRVADEMGPLPEPYSNDPTQWLFEGHPVGSTEPLQVAVARLLGYKWHQQKPDALDKHADADGIVCLPAMASEPPAAERLRALLVDAYGEIASSQGEIASSLAMTPAMTGWTLAEQERLLSAVGFASKTLDAWLRDGFFEQHAKLFHNRPFIWHIWDGRRDGFSALVNYHKLDAAKLERLIYTYLGDWLEKQKRDMEQGVAGAEARFIAAQELHKKLVAISQGEPPYDIFVRWKTLAQQPIGWNPDLNDGVRLNIRPFVTAEVLRAKFTIHWNKDRGKNPDGSERLNDLHYTRAEKEAARRLSLRTE